MILGDDFSLVFSTVWGSWNRRFLKAERSKGEEESLSADSASEAAEKASSDASEENDVSGLRREHEVLYLLVPALPPPALSSVVVFSVF